MNLSELAEFDLTNVHLSEDANMTLAQDVTYNGASIRAVVMYGETLTEGGGETGAMAMADMVVSVADVPLPAYNDTVVVGGVTWRVRHGARGDGLSWRVTLFRDQRGRR